MVKYKVVTVLKPSGVPHHEDVCGNGGIAPRMLDLGTRWWWVVSFLTRPLYPRGKCPVHIG